MTGGGQVSGEGGEWDRVQMSWQGVPCPNSWSHEALSGHLGSASNLMGSRVPKPHREAVAPLSALC